MFHSIQLGCPGNEREGPASRQVAELCWVQKALGCLTGLNTSRRTIRSVWRKESKSRSGALARVRSPPFASVSVVPPSAPYIALGGRQGKNHYTSSAGKLRPREGL